MTSPQIATDIIARDKSASGFASAEKRAQGFAKKSAQHVEKSGLAKLGKQVEGLSKFRDLDLGGGKLGASLVQIGRWSSAVSSGFQSATEKAFGFGAAGDEALSGVTKLMGGTAAAVGGVVAAAAALDMGAFLAGKKWAGVGAELDRTSRTAGVAAQDLQGLRAAGERVGVTADTTSAGINGLSGSIYAMRSGGNNEGIAVLDRLGIKLKYTKDGAADTTAMLYDLADAIAKQKDPQVQRAIAQLYGVEGMLPLLRQGSAAIKAKAADFNNSPAALSDANIAEGVTTTDEAVRFNQRLSGIEKTAGVHMMGVTSSQAKLGVKAMDGASSAWDPTTSAVSGFSQRAATAIEHGAEKLAHGGAEAGRKLVEGAKEAGSEFVAFVQRIEHQESRGHQFEYRKGRGHGTLMSDRGAVGAMQVLEETGQRAAKKAGIAWDRDRFYNDQGYNEQIGTAELFRLSKKYGGDEVLTAAAYNAGEGNVAKWIKRFGDPRTGKISDEDFAGKIPFKETRDSVENTAKAHITIELKGAPSTTVSRVSGDPGVGVDLKVAHGMDGP